MRKLCAEWKSYLVGVEVEVGVGATVTVTDYDHGQGWGGGFDAEWRSLEGVPAAGHQHGRERLAQAQRLKSLQNGRWAVEHARGQQQHGRLCAVYALIEQLAQPLVPLALAVGDETRLQGMLVVVVVVVVTS